MNALASPTNARHRGVLLAALALVVALLATMLHPGSAEARSALPQRSPTELAISNSVVALINAERHAYRLPPLMMKSQLMNSARGHDVAMARANVLSHQVRGEQALGARINAARYKWSWAGENIGWNGAMSLNGVLALQKAMYNERAPYNGHRLNILNSHFTNVGVDVYFDKAHHKVWLTVDFARP